MGESYYIIISQLERVDKARGQLITSHLGRIGWVEVGGNKPAKDREGGWRGLTCEAWYRVG